MSASSIGKEVVLNKENTKLVLKLLTTPVKKIPSTRSINKIFQRTKSK